MIIFKKSGIFYDNDINPEHEDYIYEKVDSIIPHLTEVIEFDKNLTLRDFFMLLEPDEELIDIVFGSHLGHHPLGPYAEEVKNDCVPDGKKDMDYISCSWVADQFDYRMFYEKHKDDEHDEESISFRLGLDLHEPTEEDENDISIYVDVHGWGPYDPSEDDPYDEDNPAPTHTSYAIEFTPLNRMAHLPIKLDTHFEMRDRNELGDEDPVAEGHMQFSVFEAVGAILSEISFCGLPKDRDDQWQDIVDSVDEAKEKFNDDDEDEDEEDTVE
jgi:hypothetical protein